MSRKMTVVFHNEELYTDLKVEAARRHVAASEIIAEAVEYWLDDREDEELFPLLQENIQENEETGEKSWEQVATGLEGEPQKSKGKTKPVATARKKAYDVRIGRHAERDLERIRQSAPTEDIKRLHKAIAELANNPHPPGARRIRGPGEIRLSHICLPNKGTYRS